MSDAQVVRNIIGEAVIRLDGYDAADFGDAVLEALAAAGYEVRAIQQKAPEAEVWLTCSQCGARLVMAPKSEVEAIAPYLCTKCSPPE
jgi:hypothetical protein